MSETSMADDNSEDDWRAAAQAAGIAQAKALREQARKGGLCFEAYLPPALAEWVLELVERGVFLNPGEATFVILGEHKDLEPHADLRREIIKRRLEAAENDPRPWISMEELEKSLDTLLAEPRQTPAVWLKQRKETPEVSGDISGME